MVQESEQIDKDSSAIECGYKYISDLGIDRIQKAAKKIFDSTHEDIDYGFKLYEITSINEDTFNIMDDFKPQLIVEDNIVNSLGKDTILTTWLLQDGHQLTETYEVIDLNGYEAYKVDETLYLLNKSFSISSNFTKLVELLEKDDDFIINKIVILGYSFNTETLLALKDNVRHLINGRKSADIQLEERY